MDIERTYQVCLAFKSATTGVPTPILAIGFLSYITLWTSLRSIFLTDDFGLYAKQRGLVFNHRPELGIWPGMQALIHPCAIGDALSDAGEVSQNDKSYTLIDTHIHKPSAGDMEGMRDLSGFFSGDLAIASRHLGMVLAGRFDLCSDLLPVSACGLEQASTDQIPRAITEICGNEPVFAYVHTNSGLSGLIRNIHFDHQAGLEIPCVRIVDDLDILQLGKVNIWAGVETKDEAAHTVFSGGAKRDAKICHSALVDYFDGAIVGMGIAQRRQTRLLPESGRPCLLVALVLLKERPQSPSHLLARGVHHIGIQFLVAWQPAGDTVEMAGRITDFPMLLVFFTQMKDQAIIDFGRRQHRVTKDGEAFRCPTKTGFMSQVGHLKLTVLNIVSYRLCRYVSSRAKIVGWCPQMVGSHLRFEFRKRHPKLTRRDALENLNGIGHRDCWWQRDKKVNVVGRHFTGQQVKALVGCDLGKKCEEVLSDFANQNISAVYRSPHDMVCRLTDTTYCFY